VLDKTGISVKNSKYLFYDDSIYNIFGVVFQEIS